MLPFLIYLVFLLQKLTKKYTKVSCERLFLSLTGSIVYYGKCFALLFDHSGFFNEKEQDVLCDRAVL